MEKILKKLCEVSSPSSNEEEILKEIVKMLPKSCKTHKDNTGNLIVFKNPKNDEEKKIVLTANLDEYGLMITKINDDGSLKFQPLSELQNSNCLIGSAVSLNNKLDGMVVTKPIHLQTKKEKENPTDLKDLLIEIGCNTKKEAESLVKLGDVFSFKNNFEKINENCYKSNFIGDMACCAVLIKLLQSETNFSFTAIFIVKEKAVSNSSKTAAYFVKPAMAITLKPFNIIKTKDYSFENKLLVPVYENKLKQNEELLNLLTKIAKENKILIEKLILKSSNNTTALNITSSCGGVKTAALHIPYKKYLPHATIKKENILNMFTLTKALIEKINLNFKS